MFFYIYLCSYISLMYVVWLLFHCFYTHPNQLHLLWNLFPAANTFSLPAGEPHSNDILSYFLIYTGFLSRFSNIHLFHIFICCDFFLWLCYFFLWYKPLNYTFGIYFLIYIWFLLFPIFIILLVIYYIPYLYISFFVFCFCLSRYFHSIHFPTAHWYVQCFIILCVYCFFS